MSLTKWNNSDVMFPAFSNVLDEFLGDFTSRSGSMDKAIPAVNILETENDFMLEVAAPGMSKEQFNLYVDHKQLTISAEQKEEVNKGKYARREFNYKSFKRSFLLPDFVDIEKVNATYEDGVLKIVIPKREEVKPRTIDIS
jgi:HSP20 family protein